jgi:small subunit ribosomal protein S5
MASTEKILQKAKRVKPVDAELSEKLVTVKRVAKVVKGGRRFSFTAIVVVGDMNGVVGEGLGKAGEVANAIAKGSDDAKKNLIQVPIINDTVPHQIYFKYSAAKILLRPAAPGTGILAGGAMRAVLESAGYKNVLGKSLGSSNPHSVVKATVLALASLKDAYSVAGQRNIPISKVFDGE